MRKKKARSYANDGGRLDELPDPIIHHMMSFLDVKYAIQTCVLSKRWKHLRKFLPNLIFSLYDRSSGCLKFKKFVRKVLSRRDDCCIGKFQLYSMWKLDRPMMNGILNHAVSRKVEHFCLDFYHGQPYYFPSPLSICNSIKTIKFSNIEFCDAFESHGSSFITLTSLDLYRCCFKYEIGFGDPFADYPNLKNLCLCRCTFESRIVLKISGLQLVNLIFRQWSPLSYYRVDVFAPKLASFICELDAPRVGFCGLDLPSLEYADIYVYVSYDLQKYARLDKKARVSLELIGLFQGLSNAQFVKLYPPTIEALNLVPGLLELHPSPFKRWKSSKVECMGKSFTIPAHLMAYLLGDTPHAETINVEFAQV